MQDIPQVAQQPQNWIFWVAYGAIAAFLAYDKARYHIGKKKNTANGRISKKELTEAFKEAIKTDEDQEFMKKEDCGRSPICVENTGRIIQVEEATGYLKEGIKEVKTAIDVNAAATKTSFQTVFTKLDKIQDEGNVGGG